METALTRINRLADALSGAGERGALYSKVGMVAVTAAERDRMRDITQELQQLWDEYRREYATRGEWRGMYDQEMGRWREGLMPGTPVATLALHQPRKETSHET